MEKRRTEERQEQLAKAVLEVVAAHGLRNLSVARVARRIGLVPSAIYRHFRSKDDMVDAALGFIEQRLAHNVQAACGETSDPKQQLRKLIQLHARMARDNAAIPRIVFSEDVYGGNSARRGRMRKILQGYLDRVAGIVRQGQKQKQFARTLDPSTVALMFLGIIQPAAIMFHLSDGDFDITRHTERAWKLFEYSVAYVPANRRKQ